MSHNSPRQPLLFSFHLCSSTASGEAHRGGEFEGSQGGALHYAPEPVHPQHQGGLPAERGLWIQASDQEATHVRLHCNAYTPPAVSTDI